MPYKDPEVQREYQRLRAAEIRAAWFKDKICERCGTEENLEVHHLDPSTKVSHRVWTWAPLRRLAELAKCVTLCHSCHAEETAKQRAVPIVHGTRSTYQEHRCRCTECVRAASLRREEQRRTGGRKHQASYKSTSGSIGTAAHL